MSKLLIGVLASCVLCTPLAAQQATQSEGAPDLSKPVTLEQALAVAFRENPDLKSALAQIRKSEAGMAESRANYLPKFNAEITHQWQGPTVSITLPGQTGSIQISPPTDTRGNGSVLLPLDINKRLSFTTQLARHQNELNYLNLLAVSQRLVFEVQSAYYNVLRALGQQDVAQAAVDSANEHLREAKVRLSSGTAPKFDVTRAQVEVANLNQQLIQARSRVAVARAALNRAMGVDISSPTQVVKSDIPVEIIEVDIPESIRQAQAQRPEVLSAERAIEMGHVSAKLQRTGIMPSLSATGQYNYDIEASGFSASKSSWVALLDLTIPIWDGGITKSKVAQAHADVNKAEAQLEQAKLGVALETRTAALNLSEAIERVGTADENVALAEEALRLASVRYEAGISTQVEVTDAESALTQARFNAVNARYDYIIALADLRRATSTQPEMEKLQLLTPAGQAR